MRVEAFRLRWTAFLWLLLTLLVTVSASPEKRNLARALGHLSARGLQLQDEGSPSVKAQPAPASWGPEFYSVYISDADLFDSQATYYQNFYSYPEWEAQYNQAAPDYYYYTYAFPSPAESGAYGNNPAS